MSCMNAQGLVFFCSIIVALSVVLGFKRLPFPPRAAVGFRVRLAAAVVCLFLSTQHVRV